MDLDYYNKKLESLSNEFEKTMNHAVEVMDEYIATSIEKDIVEALEAIEHFIDEISKPKRKPTIQPKPEGISLDRLAKFLNGIEDDEMRRIF
jgi:hypothetical protein